MIKELFTLILKNFKLLIRSRTSALIILLGPLLIIFLIGTAFNTTGLHSIRVATYAEDYNDISEGLLDDLRANDFSVDKTGSEEECIGTVENGGAHICIVLPADLSTEALDREITFHVDYSKINLVFTILNVITHEVEDISSELSLEYTTILLEKMNETANIIGEKSDIISQVASDAEEMKDSLAAIEESLSGMAVDAEEFGVSDVDTYISSTQANIDSFEALSVGAIDEGLALLDDMELFLDDFESIVDQNLAELNSFRDDVLYYEGLICSIDLSSIEPYIEVDPCTEISDIEDTLSYAITQAALLEDEFEDIADSFDEVRSYLEETQDYQSAMLAEASTELDTLSSQVSDAGSKLDELSTQKEDLSSSLSDIVDGLELTISEVNEIDSSIQELSGSLMELEESQAEKIVNPILTRIKPIVEMKSYLDYTLPALLVLVIMFMSLLLSTTVVMSEKFSKAYFRNYITPLPDVLFLASTYLTNIVIVIAQSMILIVIAELVFGINALVNIFNILAAIILIGSVFILLGMAIGYLFASEETGTLASISLASVFLLFSSFLIPLESLSETVASIAVFNPFVVGESMLRMMLIFQKNILGTTTELGLLVLYIVVCAIGLYFANKLDKSRIR